LTNRGDTEEPNGKQGSHRPHQDQQAARNGRLPNLGTQQAIIAEIEAEQALVSANRELIARMEKKIQATLARA